MFTKSGTLRATEPFDFKRSLSFLQGFGAMRDEQSVEKNERLTKAMMVEGRVVVFRVSTGGDRGPELRYELFSEEPLAEDAMKLVADRIAFFLSLDDDVGRFYSIVKERDPRFYPVIERLWGLHQVKFLTLLEATVWAILTQRVQRQIAIRMKRSLTERFGGNLELEGKVYWAFPDYPRLKVATARELLDVTRNQRTMDRLVNLLASFDEIDETFLRNAHYEKAEAKLRKLKGIGEWSSQFILFRSLGRAEKLHPINVRPLESKIAELYGPAGRSTQEVNELYREWSGYWSLYLWASNILDRQEEERRSS